MDKPGTDQRRAHGAGATSYAHSRDTGIGGTNKAGISSIKRNTIVGRPPVETRNPPSRQRAGLPKPQSQKPVSAHKG
jgi:hypothetical protein